MLSGQGFSKDFIEPAGKTHAGDSHLTSQKVLLAHLLGNLAASGYRFTTPTPLTHQRVISNRHESAGTTLRDIFGWNLPFESTAVTPALLSVMDSAGILLKTGNLLSSTVRISSINDDLFLHSAFPTTQDNAVFFGPDTYRFARFIQQAIQLTPSWKPMKWPAGYNSSMRILDVGCGSGAGGIVAARALNHLSKLEVFMNDINPLALQYTAVNAAFADIPVELAPGDALSAVEGKFDLIISNPPYLDDAAERAYRHGGARLGRALSVRIVAEALARLDAGGQLLLYTGVAIVNGIDPFYTEILPLLVAAGCEWTYSEIDPDVFGEELAHSAYDSVDRIAAVGLIAKCKHEVG